MLGGMQRMAVAQALGAVVFWGASFVATRLALRWLEPETLVWLRFTLGLALLAVVAAARRQLSLPRPREVPYLALLGAVGIAFHQWLQSNGLVTAQAVFASWIVSSAPVWIALLGWLVLRERLRPAQAAGIALAGLGVLLVASRGDPRALAVGGLTRGDLLILISAPNWAVFSILSRGGLARYPAAWMMLWVMAFGWLGVSALALLGGAGLGALAALPPAGWASVLFLGLGCSGLAYIFWYDALKSLPAALTGSFLYVEPVVTVLVARLLLGERLTLPLLLGGVVILAGVWLVNRAPAAQNAARIDAQDPSSSPV